MSKDPKAFKYTAITVEQQPDAPLMYVLGVKAAELLQWADVPNAKADYMAGYQRVYNEDRAKDIKDFFEISPKNIVPGAIIVTVAQDALLVEDLGDNVAKLRIQADQLPQDERLAKVYEQFHDRLSETERASIAPAVDPVALEDDGDEAEEGGIPESYLAALTAELKQAIEDPHALASGRIDAIKNYIDSVSKPGLIIDGQHRVFGAKDVTAHDVVLPVVLLPGLAVSEQVFHFYVLNNKAKPLTPTELRRTISTSLTNQEIDSLWHRFEDAGVNPEATRWTHKINTDPASPFRDMIDFGLGGGGFIRENVAYQVVSKFVNMGRKYRPLYKNINAFSDKNDERLTYFYTVWDAIKERYEDVWKDGVANGGNQFFMKAGMMVLQDYTLDQLIQVNNVRQIDGKPSPLADPDDLKEITKAVLKGLPPAFFTTEWQVKQVDTTVGRAFMRSQIDIAVQNAGKFLGNQQLFKKS